MPVNDLPDAALTDLHFPGNLPKAQARLVQLEYQLNLMIREHCAGMAFADSSTSIVHRNHALLRTIIY